MADAQLMHADKMARGEERIPRQIVRSPTIRLEGRGSFDNSQFARVGARLGSHIGRPDRDGQSKIVLRHVLAAPVMVHKFVDPCRGEYLWYKGDSNI